MSGRTAVAVLASACLAVGVAAVAAPDAHGLAAPLTQSTSGHTVLDGMARFEVLTPTMIRLEYSTDGKFENQPTMNAINRDQPVPKFTVTQSLTSTTITTASMTLSYINDSGPFTAANVTVDVGKTITAHPTWDTCQDTTGDCSSAVGSGDLVTPGTAIGFWDREVVSESVNGSDVFAPQRPGFLDTAGWYLLDDTGTAILDSPTHAVARPSHVGAYQDGYFFGYGHNYKQGLQDFESLTGPAPMLPKWTMSPWFSDYAPITQADYEDELVPSFKSHRVTFGGLVIDTNAKGPDSWNGWSWNKTLIQHPDAFLKWLKLQGLHVLLNFHPSIDGTDPEFKQAQQISGDTLKTGSCAFYRQSPTCYVFNWGSPAQAKAYFWLTDRFAKDGVSDFWLDWCCDSSSVGTAGLTQDSWINQLYAENSADKGRGFVLSRIGGGITDDNGYTGDLVTPDSGAWADHRSAISFTGDGTSDWQTLALEAKLEPGEGASIGEPYNSNDIGGYGGDHLADDLYVRWIELGALSPIMRLHSKDGDRLPWEYDARADVPATRFLRLRQELVPYLYTLGEQAHETGLPLARELAIDYPNQPAAVKATSEWTLGPDLLVAPVVSASSTVTAWIPPGRWTNFYNGQSVIGPKTMTVHAPLGQEPMWVKGILPLGPNSAQSNGADPLTVRVTPGAASSFKLYDDSGDGDGYSSGQRTFTTLSSNGHGRLTIGRRTGHYPGALSTQAYVLDFLGSGRPKSVVFDGEKLPIIEKPIRKGGALVTRYRVPRFNGWFYNSTTRTVTVTLTPKSVHKGLRVTVR